MLETESKLKQPRTKRPRRTYAQVRDLRARAISLLAENPYPKEVAHALGIRDEYMYRILVEEGYQKVFVNKAELQMLLEHRAVAAKN